MRLLKGISFVCVLMSKSTVQPKPSGVSYEGKFSKGTNNTASTGLLDPRGDFYIY